MTQLLVFSTFLLISYSKSGRRPLEVWDSIWVQSCRSILTSLSPRAHTGNSNQSVEAAREAGMAAVVVAGRHPVYELTAADLVVRQLDELSFVNLKQLFRNEELATLEVRESLSKCVLCAVLSVLHVYRATAVNCCCSNGIVKLCNPRCASMVPCTCPGGKGIASSACVNAHIPDQCIISTR